MRITPPRCGSDGLSLGAVRAGRRRCRRPRPGRPPAPGWGGHPCRCEPAPSPRRPRGHHRCRRPGRRRPPARLCPAAERVQGGGEELRRGLAQHPSGLAGGVLQQPHPAAGVQVLAVVAARNPVDLGGDQLRLGPQGPEGGVQVVVGGPVAGIGDQLMKELRPPPGPSATNHHTLTVRRLPRPAGPPAAYHIRSSLPRSGCLTSDMVVNPPVPNSSWVCILTDSFWVPAANVTVSWPSTSGST
jgi:hypothetical protein